MALVQAKCVNCGVNLQVESTKDVDVCPTCGLEFVVEKAINNYNVANNIFSTTTAANVDHYGSENADFVIRDGVLMEYNGASRDVVIPDSVHEIGDHAFEKCSRLRTVTIKEGVEKIGSCAFRECTNLAKIDLPSSITQIGSDAFSNCASLSSIVIPPNVTFFGGYGAACSGLKRIEFAEGTKEIPICICVDCCELESVIIPSSVVEICDGAFEGCISLKNVTIPSGVQIIGSRAFYGCESLTDITIPESVDAIGDHAFSKCKGITRIVLPQNLQSIEWGTFEFCRSLRSVVIPPSVQLIGDDAFRGCSNLTNVTGNINKKTIKLAFGETPLSNKKGCYIATAVYGSYDCPQVWTLRRYRDDLLAKTGFGRAFIRCYYAISPMVVDIFGETKVFQSLWRRILDKKIKRLNEMGVENTPYDDIDW